MNWYIGQKVVWVGKDGKDNDGPFEITGITKGCCSIDLETTDPDIIYDYQPGFCLFCGATLPNGIGKYRDSICYRPIEDNFATEVLENALKEGKKLDLQVKV